MQSGCHRGRKGEICSLKLFEEINLRKRLNLFSLGKSSGSSFQFAFASFQAKFLASVFCELLFSGIKKWGIVRVNVEFALDEIVFARFYKRFLGTIRTEKLEFVYLENFSLNNLNSTFQEFFSFLVFQKTSAFSALKFLVNNFSDEGFRYSVIHSAFHHPLNPLDVVLICRFLIGRRARKKRSGRKYLFTSLALIKHQRKEKRRKCEKFKIYFIALPTDCINFPNDFQLLIFISFE